MRRFPPTKEIDALVAFLQTLTDHAP